MRKLIIASKNREQVRPWLEVLSPLYSVSFTDTIETIFIEENEFEKDSLLVLDARLIHDKSQLLLICQHIEKVIILGENYTSGQQIQFVYGGACGYSDRLIDQKLITRTIEGVLRDEIWLKREFIPQMLKGMVAKQSFSDNQHRQNNKVYQTISILTEREIEVAEHVYSGQDNVSIAEQLNISNRTVKAHLSAIFRKLNVTDRFKLVVFLKDLQVGHLASAEHLF
ncbi:MAG: response regulator transcription factor [Methylococcaceae bacterium]